MYAQIVPPIAPAEKLKLLANVELFSGFSEKQLAGVSQVARVKTLERREELFHKGDEGGEIYVVSSGKLKALTTSIDGDDVMWEHAPLKSIRWNTSSAGWGSSKMW